MKRWQFWLGVLISLFFMYLALRGLHLQALAQAMGNANYLWLIPGVGVYLIAVWARAWRWHYLLRPVKSIPTRSMFPIVAIGYMGNNIYPARIGEVLRAVILKEKEDVPVSASLATIIVERVFDGVVMLAFVFLNLPELARLTSSSGFVGDIRTLAIVGAGVFLGVLLLFLLAAMYPNRIEGLVRRVVERFIPQVYAPPDLKSAFRRRMLVWKKPLSKDQALPTQPAAEQIEAAAEPIHLQEKVLGVALRFLSGLESLSSPREALMVFLSSVVIWLLETGKYWFVMHAFPFQVSFFTLMLMNGIVNLATTIPSAPGYIGTFDAPGIAVLQAYGIEKTLAAAYTLVLHAALWLPITLIGAYYLLREGIKVSDKLNQVKAQA
jgi:hypothetical protein